MKDKKSSFSPEAITGYIRAVHQELGGLHSLIIRQHGQTLTENYWHPYSAERVHLLYSLSKSFCSTAAGLAIAEGHFSLDDKVLDFFPDEAPTESEVSENLRKMRVRDLLCMGTGHDTDSTGALRQGDNNWVRAFLSHPVIHEPGTHFVYNSGATYMVSAIIQKTTGERVLDYLTPRLLTPLGIVGATWEQSPQGIDVGGWGMSVRTKDIAQFGQLYLQKGVWEGEQLLPEGWVDDATRVHISNGDPKDGNDWYQGYGFQFWRCRHGAYRGDGAFGQYVIVMPEQDAVVAITSNVSNMGAVLNLLWDYLLLGKASSELTNSPLPELTLAAPTGTAKSVPLATYTLAENGLKISEITCEFGEKTATITLTDNGDGLQTHTIMVGNNHWLETESTFGANYFGAPRVHPVAAQGGWTSENTYQFRLCYTDAPFTPTFTLTFGDNNSEVQFDLAGNIGFAPGERPIMTGTKKS